MFYFLFLYFFPIRYYDNIITLLYLGGRVIYDYEKERKKRIILVVFGQYYLEQVAQLSSFYSNIYIMFIYLYIDMRVHSVLTAA
jgi:hypothetical protein